MWRHVSFVFFFPQEPTKQHDADGAPEKPTAQTTKPCTNNFFDLLLKQPISLTIALTIL
jgi:hypothetical protein